MPTDSVELLKDAEPLLRVPVPKVVAPSLNVTVPLAVPAPGLFAQAVLGDASQSGAVCKAIQALPPPPATANAGQFPPDPSAVDAWQQPWMPLLLEAFGRAREISLDHGCLYQWVFTRGGRAEVYVTLDSPEMPRLAHLMISDLGSTALNPIARAKHQGAPLERV